MVWKLYIDIKTIERVKKQIMFQRKMVDFKRKKPKNYKDWKWTIYMILSLYEHLGSAFSASVYVCSWILLKVTEKMFTC